MFSHSTVGKGDDDACYHQTDPNENEVAPSQGGGGVGEDQIRRGGGHVTEKVDVSRHRGNHARIPKGGKPAAVKHCRGAVGGHDRQHDGDDIDHGMGDQICQEKEHHGTGEHEQNGQIHVVPQPLINEYGNKGGQRDQQGGARKDPRCHVGGEAQMLRQIGGKPEYHRGANDSRNQGDQGEFYNVILKELRDISKSLGRRRVLIVLDNTRFLKAEEGQYANRRHDQQSHTCDGKCDPPIQEGGKDSRHGRTEKGSKGKAQHTPGGVDGISILRNHLGHGTVDHG